jgi:hypothetical protein
MFEKLTKFFQGRHTMFLVACMLIGSGMAWFHKLDGNLVALLLGLQGMVLAHSTQENIFHKEN